MARGTGRLVPELGILFEFMRVVTHPRVMQHPWDIHAAWAFIEGLVASPGLMLLVETPRHAAVARAVIDEVPALAGNVLHDSHTAMLMREHGVRRISTRDTGFHRFPFLESLDPLRSSGAAPAVRRDR